LGTSRLPPGIQGRGEGIIYIFPLLSVNLFPALVKF
jgi:hypothetical protein